jgi:hypothetical protein
MVTGECRVGLEPVKGIGEAVGNGQSGQDSSQRPITPEAAPAAAMAPGSGAAIGLGDEVCVFWLFPGRSGRG